MNCQIHRLPRPSVEGGFTLIEILVVMAVLALLAAIAIPAFFSQGDKALDARAKSAARAAETAAELIATQNDGSYGGPDGVTAGNLRGVESTLDAASLTVSGISDDEYTVTVASPTGNTFSVERHANGITELSCTLSGTDGCPSDGRWDD
jgi:type IV pilus assembly protein PilA